MAQGLWVGLPDGTETFGPTTPVVKFLGELTIGASPGGANYTGATQSGSISDGRFTQYAGHVAFWCRNDGGFSSDGYDATWSISGNTLTWTYPRPVAYINGNIYNRPVQTIIYGIR